MPQSNEMTPLENKELRGLNLKNIVWLLGCTITIIMFLWQTTDKLNTQIKGVSDRVRDIEIRSPESQRYDDQRLKYIELQIQQLSIQINELRQDVAANTKTLKEK